jgi:hypothetical protein
VAGVQSLFVQQFALAMQAPLHGFVVEVQV